MNKPVARPPLKIPGAKSPSGATTTTPSVASSNSSKPNPSALQSPAISEHSVPTYASHMSAMGWALLSTTLLASIFFRFYYGTSVNSVSRDTSALLWYLTAMSVVLHLPATFYLLATKRKPHSTAKQR